MLHELKDIYFDWLCNIICDEDDHSKEEYYELLLYLNQIDFEYTLEMDANRALDGIDFRYRFGYEMGIDERDIAFGLDDHPCSVLEMMISLSWRCEENIMSNQEFGDRTAFWFWDMIRSLHLINMSDLYFDLEFVKKRIDIFTNRKYKKNGDGGLFTISKDIVDMRDLEIWYQMMAYLNEFDE